MKRIVLFIFFIPFFLSAQEKEKDSIKVRADLALTGFWQGGNVETLIFRANSNVSFKPWNRWVFKTQNSYVFQEFGGDKADEDILSLNFLYIHPEKRFHPLLLGFFSTNFRREIRYRYLVGGGFSYQVFKNKNSQLKMSLTTEYENTDFKTTDFNENEFDGMKEIDTWRTTLWMNGRYEVFTKKMIITHEMFFQPSLESGNNFRWRADLGLEFPVWKFLNFKINYLRTYESIVVASQQQEDEFLTFGFTIKSY